VPPCLIASLLPHLTLIFVCHSGAHQRPFSFFVSPNLPTYILFFHKVMISSIGAELGASRGMCHDSLPSLEAVSFSTKNARLMPSVSSLALLSIMSSWNLYLFGANIEVQRGLRDRLQRFSALCLVDATRPWIVRRARAMPLSRKVSKCLLDIYMTGKSLTVASYLYSDQVYEPELYFPLIVHIASFLSPIVPSLIQTTAKQPEI
jgi:hypothetical protein